MNILITGANGQLGNEMRIVSKDSADKYITKLKEDGNEIYIITGRDNGEYSDPYNMTIEWLRKYDIIFSIFPKR